jgi:hypothetical protein
MGAAGGLRRAGAVQGAVDQAPSQRGLVGVEIQPAQPNRNGIRVTIGIGVQVCGPFVVRFRVRVGVSVRVRVHHGVGDDDGVGGPIVLRNEQQQRNGDWYRFFPSIGVARSDAAVDADVVRDGDGNQHGDRVTLIVAVVAGDPFDVTIVIIRPNKDFHRDAIVISVNCCDDDADWLIDADHDAHPFAHGDRVTLIVAVVAGHPFDVTDTEPVLRSDVDPNVQLVVTCDAVHSSIVVFNIIFYAIRHRQRFYP